MQFGTPVPLLIGLILIIGAVVLFFLDKLKPGYGRDADKIYSVLLLIAGMCALGELQLGIFPSFQLLIMAGMLLTLMIENIRNRTPLEPARPGSGGPPRGGRPRPVDRRPPDRRPVYQAELDDWDRFDDRGGPRSMPAPRGYDDGRYRPRPTYDDRPPMRRLNPGEPMGDSNGARQANGRPSGPVRDNYGPPPGYRDDYGPRDRGPRSQNDSYSPTGPADGRSMSEPPRPVSGPPGPAPLGRPPEGYAADARVSDARMSEGRPVEGRRSERTLDVRPYSEAPKPDEGSGEDYLDFRPVEPDEPKDDSDWR